MTHRDYYAYCAFALRDLGITEEVLNSSCLVDELITDGWVNGEDCDETVDLIYRRIPYAFPTTPGDISKDGGTGDDSASPSEK
jgi:hypothetical protein